MSNEYNEQIKERCYEQAEWEVLKSGKIVCDAEDKEFWEDIIEKKAKELYDKE